MYGRASEEKKRGWHMWKGSTRSNSVVAGDVSSSPSISPANSFSKDGRKISVGDCALFKPPQDAPPFIGIIRWLINGEESNLRLCVNWLYRPSEVKLGKGILLEAEPNEVFYSFHQDEISAASLLHPCKVAFLAKGAKLPSGICSYVCRRVYDTTNKCLWWLTDKDYINEHQEEIDKLLYNSRVEMHATAQPGGRSPKPMNGPTTASHIKPSSDSIHNSSASFPSQGKGKKRERVDQGSEPVKRERVSKTDDGDSGHSRPESFWKSEVAKFTEKGGLVDTEGAEKLVRLMLPGRTDKKIDLVGRSVLAGVIAATDKFDCLSRFVQLRGLPVFDEWLQEVHKGRIGEGSNLKDNDKPVEEFLLVLLQALDKLPVNLHALQMCYIGKSVNHLRTHKNLDIQKKARSLVDTWKKRVEAEMDAKSGSNQSVSWAARQRHSGTTSEITMKSSGAQLSASKSLPVKLVQGEPKSVSAPPGSLKSSPSLASVGNNLKEGQTLNTGAASMCDTPLVTAGDDKSSSSSQSHNNSQSCSSDHAKTGGYSGKEDARSSTAVSVATKKAIRGSSRHRKPINGFQEPTSSPVQKETRSSRNLSSKRNPDSDKLTEPSLMSEKVVEFPASEVSNHKLIVKLSNKGRSPGRSVSGGSLEDPSIMISRGSSAVQHDQLDRNSKEKNDVCRVNLLSDGNVEPLQSDDPKEVLNGSGDGDQSRASVPDENYATAGNDARKLEEISKAASSSPGNEGKSLILQDASYSSMNALIESCAKYSEENVSSVSGADDVGMNLLASVATGEMSKLELASPIPSPQRMATVGEHSCSNTDIKIQPSRGNNFAPERGQLGDDKSSVIPIKNKEDKPVLSPQEKLLAELNGHVNASPMDAKQVSEPCMESNVKTEDKFACKGIETLAVVSSSLIEKSSNSKGIETLEEKSCDKLNEGAQSVSKEVSDSFDHEDKVPGVFETESTALPFEGTKGSCVELDSGNDAVSENFVAVKADEADCGTQAFKKQKTEESNVGSAASDLKGICGESIVGSKGTEQIAGEHVCSQKLSPRMLDHAQQARSGGSRLNGADADETECTSEVMDTAPYAAGDSSKEGKLEFDLNEGFNSDDGRSVELSNLREPESSSHVPLISPLSLPVSPSSTGIQPTVTSAAKRPFVPPEDLLKNKVELGWRGSAATSAFRPAEPRKSLESPLTISNSLPDVPATKATRPPLDIDLNVADEIIQDDLAFRTTVQGAGPHNLSQDGSTGTTHVHNSGGLDLDLNRVDEPVDIITINGHNREVRARRDFDLNDGPLVDEASVEQSSFGQINRTTAPIYAQSSVSTLRMNSADIGKFSPWFTQGNPYSAAAVQSEQPFSVVAPGGPQRMLAASVVSTPFTPDVYRGPVFSSSPAVPFPSAPFQYPVFSYGNFSLHSTAFSGGPTTYVDSSSGRRICFPTMHSQVLGPSGAVQSHYNRPFVVGLPDNNSSGGAESGRKWGPQGLDLNTGPVGPDIEGRDGTSSLASRQLSANSQATAEEQSRIFQAGYKQASWQ